MDPINYSITGLLLAGLAIVWKMLMQTRIKQDADAAKCEQDKAELLEKYHDHDKRIAVFETCPNDPCGARIAFAKQQHFSEKPHNHEH